MSCPSLYSIFLRPSTNQILTFSRLQGLYVFLCRFVRPSLLLSPLTSPRQSPSPPLQTGAPPVCPSMKTGFRTQTLCYPSGQPLSPRRRLHRRSPPVSSSFFAS